MRKFFIFLLLLLLTNAVLTGQSLEFLWQTDAIFKVPESVFFNIRTQNIYVSNINGKPTEKNGNGFISLLSSKGKIINLKWVKGLNAPKGMAVFNNILYVSDIDRLAAIDIFSGKIIRFYTVNDARFLNDVAVDNRGDVYVSDSDKGVIFRMENNGHFHIWDSNPILKEVNGLAIENRNLVAGAYGHLLQINIHNKSIQKLTFQNGIIDGLIPIGNGYYVVSNWSGKIQLVAKGKKAIVLSNTSKQKINAADLGYIPQKKVILIPTFFNNKVIAKKLIFPSLTQ